ncbi:MAG TPA: SDR family NAD(P)-dependent oxidoreductase [Acidimicrobiales bacterium]|nr:SDR family NAD(P)-dependent oxidoreductase [Acidimicrobiales bacterium]
MERLHFYGRSVIVTGAGRGVGRAHALMLADRGARVVVADIGGGLDGEGSSAGPAEEVAEEILAAGGEAVACHASVAEEAGAARIVATAVDAFGGVDALVNNAGIAAPDWFEDLPAEQFRRMVDVHYLGTVYLTQAAWPHLVRSGEGRVVNTCSEAGFGTVPKNTSYGGAKGAVFGFTRSLALDGARHGVRVNAVAPRANTRLSAPPVLSHTFDVAAEAFAGVMDTMRPDLVAPVAAFLAHPSCRLNGEVLIAGAGQVMRLAVVRTRGIDRPDLTPEDVAADLGALMDMEAAELIEVVGAVDGGAA